MDDARLTVPDGFAVEHDGQTYRYSHAQSYERKDGMQRWLTFGDNEQRHGRGGLAAVCRGHANAIGVATKRSPSRAPNVYWSDDEFERVVPIIDADLAPAREHIRAGGIVVCQSAGLGTGRAELKARAPRVFAALRARIVELKRMGDLRAAT